MKTIAKIYSDFHPDGGRSKTWWLKFEDGSLAATIDSSSGRDRFRLVDMLGLYRPHLGGKLSRKLAALKQGRRPA